MKILQVFNHFWPCIGGIEKVVMDQALYLRKQGHEVGVVCLNKCSKGTKTIKAKEEWNGVKIYRIPFINLKYYLVAPRVLKFVKEYDVVHVHGIGFFSDFLLATKFLHKKPLVLNTHGGFFHTKSLRAVKKVWLNSVERVLLRGADALVADSANDYKIFGKISSHVRQIANPVNVEKFARVQRKVEKDSFLFVGRLSRNKRVDLLLEMIARVEKEKPNAKLFVVGQDFEGILQGLKEKTKELGIEEKVVFAGEVSEEKLMEFFSRAEFFASASEYEGFGVSAIEAMAAGIVPLLNDIPSFKEFVENGKNGFILKFEEKEKTSKRVLDIMKLGNAEKKALAIAAQASVQKFGWNSKIKEFEKIYREVVK